MKAKRSNMKDFGLTGLARIGVATVLAFGGLMTVGVGISNATAIQTEGTYPTREACHAAGPGVKATTPGNWNTFWCVPAHTAANTWRLVLAN